MTTPEQRVITISGNSGGKLELATRFSQEIGLPLLNTGDVFRIMAYIAYQKFYENTEGSDSAALSLSKAQKESLLSEFQSGKPALSTRFLHRRIWFVLDDLPIYYPWEEESLRYLTEKILMSFVGDKEFREFAEALWKEAIPENGAVVIGRRLDQVFPDALLHFFVQTEYKAAANHRQKNGLLQHTTPGQFVEHLEERDKVDRELGFHRIGEQTIVVQEQYPGDDEALDFLLACYARAIGE